MDLRDYGFMPIDIGRLFNSEFHAQANDAAWRAGVTLWLKGYHQVPAASLPDDDIALARLAEMGRDLKSWRKVRDGALRGWMRCSDGRLYHRTVAEKALDGWIEKLTQRKSSGAGNAKRYGYSFDVAGIDAAIEVCRMMLATLNPHSRVLAKRGGKPPVGTPGGSADGNTNGTPENLPSGSQGTGTDKGQERESSLRSDRAGARLSPDQLFDRLSSAAGGNLDRNSVAIEVVGPIEDLIALGCDLDRHVLPTIRRVVPPLDRPLWTWGARWLREKILSAKASDPAGVRSEPSEPRFEFGGGYSATHGTIRRMHAKGIWPPDWGPRPGEEGCRIPPDLLERILGEGVAA